MRRIFPLFVTISIAAVAFTAAAQDPADGPVVSLPSTPAPAPAVPATVTPPAAVAPTIAPSVSMPSPAQTAASDAQAAPSAPPSPVIATLKDGSKIELTSDGSVLVLNADGSTGPVPDGLLTLRDNTTFAVRDGKRVDE